MDILNIFSAFGLSASAGLNAYIPLLIVALVAKFTHLITLSTPWDMLTNGWIIALLAVLSLVEFFADKIPAVNHINDAIQTFIRPAAGAILFAASANVVTNVHPVLALGLGVLVAGGVHAVKAAAVRPAVTATTAGMGNIVVSTLEDLISTALSILSLVLPVVVAILILVFLFWIVYRAFRRSENYSKA